MLVPAALLVLACQGPPPEAHLVTLENHAELAARLVPREDELRWRSIPWRPTLRQGLADGAQLRRPVLLWAMNGHPLGST